MTLNVPTHVSLKIHDGLCFFFFLIQTEGTSYRNLTRFGNRMHMVYAPLSRTKTENTKWLVCLWENAAQVWETKHFSWLIKFSRYKLWLLHTQETPNLSLSHPDTKRFSFSGCLYLMQAPTIKWPFLSYIFYLVDLFCFTFMKYDKNIKQKVWWFWKVLAAYKCLWVRDNKWCQYLVTE